MKTCTNQDSVLKIVVVQQIWRKTHVPIEKFGVDVHDVDLVTFVLKRYQRSISDHLSAILRKSHSSTMSHSIETHLPNWAAGSILILDFGFVTMTSMSPWDSFSGAAGGIASLSKKQKEKWKRTCSELTLTGFTLSSTEPPRWNFTKNFAFPKLQFRISKLNFSGSQRKILGNGTGSFQ